MDSERCWQAVLARDTSANGTFVFAVRSTGIYCRPSCPARRPRREQVVFFSRPEQAERAGFRACRRCRPTASDPAADLVSKISGYIKANPDGPLTLAALAAKAGLSPHHLQRAFKRATGVSPREYADALRLRRLKSRLQGGHDVTTALYDAGYGSSSRLYEHADSQLGMTPGAYRRGGAGMRLDYTIAACPLGRLLVAGTARGVSAIYLGDSDARLEKSLADEYPRAERQRDRNGLWAWVRTLLRHLEGEQRRLDLPLDVQATAFQRRVWQELQRIPYGATRTYSQVARAIGRPSATRAVARACATNPVSVVVPCHRVVREDGGLGGYRWGLDRKQRLLDRERAAANR